MNLNICTKRKSNFPKNFYEHEAWAQGQLICGVDEVGRSSLAGPVVAAAVILKPGARYRLLKDSKLLTAEERLKAYRWLLKNSVFGVGIINHRRVDGINIYQATLAAMHRAVMQLCLVANHYPAHIVVDAMPLRISSPAIPVTYFWYGEKKSVSIAAASIIAKVTRDLLMERTSSCLPGYNFERNKGYGTKMHRLMVRNSGSSFMHRQSFLKNVDSWDDLSYYSNTRELPV